MQIFDFEFPEKVVFLQNGYSLSLKLKIARSINLVFRLGLNRGEVTIGYDRNQSNKSMSFFSGYARLPNSVLLLKTTMSISGQLAERNNFVEKF